MGLPWVRLDSNIASHDKILHLLSDPSAALSMVYGTPQTARLLVAYHLWTEATAGYQIRNFAQRQELLFVTESKRAAQRAGALKGNCIRHHGPDCGCWRNGLADI